MELLVQYDSDQESQTEVAVEASCIVPFCSAPIVSSTSIARIQDFGGNSKAEILLAPYAGPANPFVRSTVLGTQGSRSGHGFIESTFVEDYSFESSYQEFLRDGLDSTRESKKNAAGNASKKARLSRLADSDIGDSTSGPWMSVPEEDQPAEDSSVTKQSTVEHSAVVPSKGSAVEVVVPRSMFIVEPDEEAEKWEKVNERKQAFLLPPRPERGSIAGEAKTAFHGDEEADYLGRSWVTAPPGTRPSDGHECFIPKKCIKKYIGHSKGVQAIELFPQTGHLLLSASMDGTCKVWDVLRHKNLMRTYSGHCEAVRSVHMANDGLTFLSSGYDRYIRLWDLETGQAVATYSNRKMHYQVKFHPTDNNTFICASSDNKMYQWDSRQGTVVQEYNYHLQACNTVTFIEDGRKLVSTSDDKKILVWEFGIPVPIKYIADAGLHSVPSITVSPNGQYFCGQSMDNSIVTYQVDGVKQMRKKTFRGHNNSGYACQVGFSSNGKYIVSGDGQGKLNFWDWKSGKLFRKMQAHDKGPSMGALWHPLQPSWVFTCGWDGQIKLWD